MFTRTMVPPEKLVPLIPRLYQTDIFKIGIQKNIMIRLDTGLGKTFIASMIIKHFASIPDLTKKIIVFIVPTVSLALQQGRTLGETTLLKVKAFVGYHGVDYWKRDQWISELNDTDVAIFTAQVWLNVLDNAYWDLSRVKLMVLDEAHHTRKAHPYCKIMQMHYHINKQENKSVPRICAMTASPFFNLKRPEASLRTLESNLDAVTYEVKEGQTDLETFSRKPDEKTILYDDPILWGEPSTETITYLKNLMSHLEASDAADKVLLYMRKTYERALAVANKLGSLAADLYVPAVFHNSDLLEIHANSLEDVRHHSSYDSTLVTPHVQALLNELDRTFKRKGATCVVFVEQRYEAFILSRIVELWQRSIYAPDETLEDYCSSEKRLIRTGYIVGHTGGGTSTGSSSLENMKNEFGQTNKEQSRQVSNFTSGKINLLFATKVAEEGLDFQSCNSVMRFDPIDTFTGYIQSRGRARKDNSEFVVFVSRYKQVSDKFRIFQGSERQMKDLFANREHLVPEMPVLERFPRFNVPETGALLSYHNAVPLLHDFCALLPYDVYTLAPQPAFTMLKLYSEEDAIQADLDGEVSDWADALDKMHVFNCEEEEAKSNDEDYPEPAGAVLDEAPGIFQTVVELPLIPSFPTRKRIVGPPMRTKRLARQGAAYLMCLKLYNVGALDKHMMPIRHYRGKGAVDVSGNYVDREEYQDHYEMTEDNVFGNMWDEKNPVYLNVFEARIVRQTGEESFEFTGQTEGVVKKEPKLVSEPGAYTIRFGWVCGNPLSAFHRDKLFTPIADERLVITFISSSTMDWSIKQKQKNLDALADFNATLIRTRVNHNFNLKKSEKQFSLWVPLVDDAIAWDLVREPSTKLTRQSDLSNLCPGQLMLAYVIQQGWLNLFSFDSIRKDVTSNSRTADVLRIHSRVNPKLSDTTERFPIYKSLARATFGRRILEIKYDESNKNIVDDEYPIVTLRRLNQHVPNLLTQRWAQVTSQQYSPDTGEYIGNGLEECDDNVFLDDHNLKAESLGETFQIPDVYQKGSLGIPEIYGELHGGLSNLHVDLPAVDIVQKEDFKTLGGVVTAKRNGKTGTTGETVQSSGEAVTAAELSPDPVSMYPNPDPVSSEESEARKQSEYEKRRYAHVPPMACAISHIPYDFWRLVSYLPSIDRLVTDNIRVVKTIQRMDFPDIDIPTMREALTPTGANTGYDYQILETMGDSFLKFSTTIHSYLTLRHYDEGALSVVRDNSVDNRFLCQQSVASDFLHAILINKFRTRTWCVPLSDNAVVSSDGLSALRGVNRRAVCDTVESVLGAAYLTRGINAGLKVGARIGLCFGGADPWAERLPEPRKSPVPASLRALEANLGYTFRDGSLLLQAVTHRGYTSALTHCYEREEYLGDALLDFWATNMIYRHCPGCTPRFLTFTRAMLVSNSTLSLLGIRTLGVQGALLHTSETLAYDIAAAVSDAEALEWSEVLKDLTWFWHAPKVLGDAVEALIGAAFVDSGCNLSTVFRILDTLYAPIITFLGHSERRDPYTTLVHWIQGHGCRKAGVRVQLLDASSRERVGMVTYHGKIIGRAVSGNIGVARQLASRQALDWLRSEDAAVDGRLDVCDCKARRAQSAIETLPDKRQEKTEDSTLLEKGVDVGNLSEIDDLSLVRTPDVLMGASDDDSESEIEFAGDPGDSTTKYLIEEIISNTVEGAEETEEDTSHLAEYGESDSAHNFHMMNRHLPAEGETLEWFEERDSALKRNNRIRQYE